MRGAKRVHHGLEHYALLKSNCGILTLTIPEHGLLSNLLDYSFKVKSCPSVSVNLDTKICSCYQWQVCRFSCVHASTVINKTCPSVYNQVSSYFFTDNLLGFVQCYHPPYTPNTPPVLKRNPGRPKKKRVY